MNIGCAFLCRHCQGAPEDQAVTKRRDVAFGLHERDEPRAVGDLAVENRAGQTALTQNELLVLAAPGVAQGELLVAVVARFKHAGGKNVDAGDLQAGMENGRDIRLRAVAAESDRTNARLLPQRTDQAERLPVMLDAFAHGENAALARRHEIVDDDAAIDIEPCGAREIDVGPHADGEDDEIGRKFAPIGELHGLYAVVTDDGLGLRLRQHGYAAAFEVALKEQAGRLVELALHQALHEMEHGDRHAASHQAEGRFEPEQPAADHDGATTMAAGLAHELEIRDIAKSADAGKLQP